MLQAAFILTTAALTALVLGALFIAAASRSARDARPPRDPRALFDALSQSSPLAVAFVTGTLLISAMMWFAASPF